MTDATLEFDTTGKRIGQRSRSGLERAKPEELQMVGRYSRQIELEILARNRNAALNIIDQAIADLDPPTTIRFYARSVASLVDVRTANALEQELGVITVAQLLEQELNAILSVPNISSLSAIRIYQALLAASIEEIERLSRLRKAA